MYIEVKRGRGRPRKIPLGITSVLTIDNKPKEGETVSLGGQMSVGDNKQKGFIVLDKKSGRKYYLDDNDNDFALNAHGDLIQVCYGGNRAGESVFVIRKVKQEDFEIVTETKDIESKQSLFAKLKKMFKI